MAPAKKTVTKKHQISALHSKLVPLIFDAQSVTGERDIKKLLIQVQEIYYTFRGSRVRTQTLKAHQTKCVEHMLDGLSHIWAHDEDMKSPLAKAATKFVTDRVIIETSRNAKDLELKYKVDSLGPFEPIFVIVLRFAADKFKTMLTFQDQESVRLKVFLLRMFKQIVDQFYDHESFQSDPELVKLTVETFRILTSERSTQLQELAILSLGNFVNSDKNVSKWIVYIIDHTTDNLSIIRACARALHNNGRISSSVYMKLLHVKGVEVEALTGLRICGIDRLKNNSLLEDILDWGLKLGNKSKKDFLVQYMLKPWIDNLKLNIFELLCEMNLGCRPNTVNLVLNALYPGSSYETWIKLSPVVSCFLSPDNNLVPIKTEIEQKTYIKYELWVFLCSKFINGGSQITSKLVPQPLDYVNYIKSMVDSIIVKVLEHKDLDIDCEELWDDTARALCLAYALKIGSYVFWEESNRREMFKVLKLILLKEQFCDPLVLGNAVDLAQQVTGQDELVEICHLLLMKCSAVIQENREPPEYPNAPEIPAASTTGSLGSFGSLNTQPRKLTVQGKLDQLQQDRAELTLYRNKLVDGSGNLNGHVNGKQDKINKCKHKEAVLDTQIQKLKELDPNSTYIPDTNSSPKDTTSILHDIDEEVASDTNYSQEFDQNFDFPTKIKALVIFERILHNSTQPFTPQMKSFMDDNALKLLDAEDKGVKFYMLKLLCYRGLYDKTKALSSFLPLYFAAKFEEYHPCLDQAFKGLIDICLRFEFKYLFRQYSPEFEGLLISSIPNELTDPESTEAQLESTLVGMLLEIYETRGKEDSKFGRYFTGVWVKGIIKLFLAKRIAITSVKMLEVLLSIWVDPVEKLCPPVPDIEEFVPMFVKSSWKKGQLIGEAMLECIAHIVRAKGNAESFGEASVEDLVQFVMRSTFGVEKNLIHDYIALKVCSLISSNLPASQNKELLTVLKYCTIQKVETRNEIRDTLNKLEEVAVDAEPAFAKQIKMRSKIVEQKLKKMGRRLQGNAEEGDELADGVGNISLDSQSDENQVQTQESDVVKPQEQQEEEINSAESQDGVESQDHDQETGEQDAEADDEAESDELYTSQEPRRKKRKVGN